MSIIEFEGVELSDPDVADAFGDDVDEVFEELYSQHVNYVRTIARASTKSHADAEDVTAEVFAGLLLALRNGGGPVASARPYLRACVRHEAARARTRGGRHRLVNTDPGQLDTVVGETATQTTEEDSAERETIVSAFRRLSDRHRAVLVATEVDERSHTDLGRELQLSPTAVAALAKRARDAFARSYLDEHIGHATGECRTIRQTLSAVVRGTETPRRRRSAYEHLQHCRSCADIHNDLANMNKMLRALPAGVLVASGGLGGGGAATGALAALKNLLGLGSGGSGASGAAGSGGGAGAAAAGGAGIVGWSASGFAGIHQVATVATLALSGIVITGDASTSEPQKAEAAATPPTEAPAWRGGELTPSAESSTDGDSVHGRFDRDDLPRIASSRPAHRVDVVERQAEAKRDDKARRNDGPAAVARVETAEPPPPAAELRPDSLATETVPPAPAAPSAPTSVVAPAAPPATPSPADDGDPVPAPAPTSTSTATSRPSQAPPPSAPSSSAPPPAGPIEQVTEGVDETVDGIIDTGGTVVKGVTDGGADLVDDLGGSLDEVLEEAGLPPLAGDLTGPVGDTLRSTGETLDDTTELADVTVDELTDLVNEAVGEDGIVDLDQVLNDLLGGQ